MILSVHEDIDDNINTSIYDEQNDLGSNIKLPVTNTLNIGRVHDNKDKPLLTLSVASGHYGP